jgi:FeoB-associated Cys-rich membrane protein
MWQEIIVALCIISACIFLVRKWFFNKKTSACGGCSGCEKNASSCDTQKNPL